MAINKDTCGAPDWMDNLDLRISNIEEWKREHETAVERRITEMASFRVGMDNLKESVTRQDSHLEKQDAKMDKQNEKLDKMAASINKMILGIAGTVILLLVKLVIDLSKINIH